jgi:hypothetical protein
MTGVSAPGGGSLPFMIGPSWPAPKHEFTVLINGAIVPISLSGSFFAFSAFCPAERTLHLRSVCICH